MLRDVDGRFYCTHGTVHMVPYQCTRGTMCTHCAVHMVLYTWYRVCLAKPPSTSQGNEGTKTCQLRMHGTKHAWVAQLVEAGIWQRSARFFAVALRSPVLLNGGVVIAEAIKHVSDRSSPRRNLDLAVCRLLGACESLSAKFWTKSDPKQI